MSKEFENKRDLDAQREKWGVDFIVRNERKAGGFAGKKKQNK